MTEALAVLALGLACVGWYLVQAWTGNLDGDEVQTGCGSCTADCDERVDGG